MQFKFNECDIVALCRNVIDMVEKIKQTQAEVRFSTSQFTEADHGQCPPATSTDQSAYQRHKVYCTRHYHPGTGETNGRYGPFSPLVIPVAESPRRTRTRYSTASKSSMKTLKAQDSDYLSASLSSSNWEAKYGSTRTMTKEHVFCSHNPICHAQIKKEETR